jgi:choline dehydrogenase-like flavoprotein
LYIADGAVLTDLPAKHCTLTIMANADRIARYLAARIVSER